MERINQEKFVKFAHSRYTRTAPHLPWRAVPGNAVRCKCLRSKTAEFSSDFEKTRLISYRIVIVGIEHLAKTL
jgi:hypothetical protein